MSCTHSSNCELYARFAADPSIELWKKHYCNSEYKKCARYEIALKSMAVPLDLLPNGKRVATEFNSMDVTLNTLFNAIKKDRLPMVKTVIKVNSTDSQMANNAGITAAMFAASLGRKEMVELFLTKGCNPHQKCNSGKTALDYAQDNNHADCAEVVKTYMKKIQPEVKTQETSKTETEKPPSSSLFGRLFGFLRGSNQKAA